MKTNHRLKSVISIIAVAILCILPISFLASCKEEQEEYTAPIFELPSGLPSYTGTIEWLDEVDYGKPFVVLFHGVSDVNVKESITLSSEIYSYNGGVLSDNSKNMNMNLYTYWKEQGYNFGIFHYECFAFGSEEEIAKKIYDSSAMSYKNKSGEIVENSGLNYTLTELFASEWLNTIGKATLEGTKDRSIPQEIRFIGNSVGSLLATSSAQYLYELYAEGKISGSIVPNRIAMTNPYLSNTQISYKISLKSNTAVTSILSNEYQTIKKLADNGTIFEMVESDLNYFENYTYIYCDNDKALYNAILSQCATLYLNENYSSLFPYSYKLKDRVALDWYLYSVIGSDDASLDNDSITNRGRKSTLPIVDKRMGVGEIIPSANTCRYGVSAWTPSAYIRALKGHIFETKKNTVNYVMNRFQSECYQFSNVEDYILCGYVFLDNYESKVVDFGYQNRLSGIKVTIKKYDSEAGDNVYEESVTHTTKDGFYSFKVDSKYYGQKIEIKVSQTSQKYDMYATATASGTYNALNYSNVSAGGTSGTFTSAPELGQIIVYNCAMRLY